MEREHPRMQDYGRITSACRGFCREIAEIWIEDMRYPELAEYTVMNLFQRLPYASEVVFHG